MTALYSVLHLLVDGICALAMFGKFIPLKEGYYYILLYNFCAFALQMPFGAALDILCEKGGKNGKGKPDPAFSTAVAGVLCTIVGAFTHPLVLGVGNALFHVGGGVGTIREDHAAGSRGARLGVFVAPGALGLYLGSLIVERSGSEKGISGNLEGFVPGDAMAVIRQAAVGPDFWLLGGAVFMLVLLALGGLYLSKQAGKDLTGGKGQRRPDTMLPVVGVLPKEGTSVEGIRLAFCCMLVVVLRSYVGMAVSFPWKSGMAAGLLGVLAVVGGKAVGGILAARFGARKTVVFSLLLAAACYLLSSWMPLGLAALFLFQMTMPVTLYRMACGFPGMPGFAFGFLTFALFLGFLPVYFEAPCPWSGSVLGSLGSVLSLLLLWAGTGMKIRKTRAPQKEAVTAACGGNGERGRGEKLSD